MSEHICSKCGRVNSGYEVEAEVERTKLPRKTIRDRREFDNTYHPGVESADLVHTVHMVRVGERKPYPGAFQPGSFEIPEARGNPKQLCHNCGWNTLNELHPGGYTSRLKVFYLRDNSAIWELGANGPWMLRDEPNNGTNAWKKDYMVQQFLRKEKPSIPLVEMHKFGGAEDKFHFTMMFRAKGSTMGSIWDTLTREQKADVLQDLYGHIKEWRQITRPQMQKVDGSELRDAFIGNCTGYGCIKTGENEEVWLENLTPGIRKGLLWELWDRNKGWDADLPMRDSWIKEVDEKIAELKANFPRGGPYVLTHGDLHLDNIFISDANSERKFKISAILDWELAGFFPWWAEDIRAILPHDSWQILGPDSDILHPGYDTKAWGKIWKDVYPVKESWSAGGYHGRSKHGLGQANSWYRPPFCACKPYAQEYRDKDLGWEQEHTDVFDVDSTDSEDSEEEWEQKFNRYDRQFMRWFKEISSRNSKDPSLTQFSPP
ncbi:hypothetical protein B0J14DRAFT_570493 [Halenospora varia]|nr:hypothetical protein B0J14DRAFT_570493 [Halenospora varia]